VIRVRLAIDRGDFARARTLAGQGPGDHSRLNALRGRLALLAGDARQAAAFLRAALRGDPQDRDTIHGLGAALQRLGDPAAKEFLQAASRHDQIKRLVVECGNSRRIDIKVFSQLGAICESLGQLEQARVWYQVALGWDPLDSQAHQGLARLAQAEVPNANPPTSQPDKTN
jgi:Flp pilus assembly protein TadD